LQNPGYGWLKAALAGLALTGFLGLSACTIPGGDTPADLGPGVGAPFPNLASVPDQPPIISTEEQRSQLLQQLQGQRNSANEAAGVNAGQQVAALPAGPVAVIYFAESSTALTDRDQAILAEVAKILTAHGGGRLRVVGHASQRGDGGQLLANSSKDRLATRRARAIADALYQDGVARSAVQVDAVGTTQPVYQEINPNGIAGNRRAEIYLES
jgi:outer membrane protein OmpA-like peptidoglycan-associated protein